MHFVVILYYTWYSNVFYTQVQNERCFIPAQYQILVYRRYIGVCIIITSIKMEMMHWGYRDGRSRTRSGTRVPPQCNDRVCNPALYHCCYYAPHSPYNSRQNGAMLVITLTVPDLCRDLKKRETNGARHFDFLSPPLP